jgi:hypothetical protein
VTLASVRTAAYVTSLGRRAEEAGTTSLVAALMGGPALAHSTGPTTATVLFQSPRRQLQAATSVLVTGREFAM